MTYRVQIHDPAKRSIMQMPPGVAGALLNFLEVEVSENPHRVGKELREPLAGKRSARRGEYRVVYEIDEADQIIHVLLAQHRRDVYR